MNEKVKKFIELRNEIQKFRGYLNNLILKNDNLLDPEILTVSKKLDILLNEYNKLIDDKIDNDD